MLARHTASLWGRMTLCVAAALGSATDAAETGRLDLADPKDPLAASADFLPVDQAFVFSSRSRITAAKAEEIVARWDMPAGYYLYRQHFQVDAGEGVTLGEPVIPLGEARSDEYFGESEVYFGSVEINIAVVARSADTVTARFGYQGCAERGLCYPPAERVAAFQFAQAMPVLTGWPAWIWGVGVVGLFILAAWAMRSRRDVR